MSDKSNDIYMLNALISINALFLIIKEYKILILCLQSWEFADKKLTSC